MKRRPGVRSAAVACGCRRWPVAACAVAAVLGAPAWAQDAPAGRGLQVSTYIDASSSVLVNSLYGGRDAGDLSVEVRPGVSVASNAGRVIGALGYSLGLVQRSRRGGDSESGVVHNLSAQFSAEALERWLYVDGTAGYSRQSADPYGVQGLGNSAAAEVSTAEVATASLSPYVKGALGTTLTYEVRLNASGTNTRRSLLGDATTYGGNLSLASPLTGRLVGWGLVASSQETDYRVGRTTRNERWSGSVYWIPDPDLTLTLRGGQERTDVGQFEAERYSNWGGGITWRPSPRTRVQLDGDERYFGTSYRLVLDYRTPQTTLLVGSSRADNIGPNQRASITAFQLRDAQLASAIPDRTLRQQQVLADLALLGQNPDDIVFSSLINGAITVVERHDASFGYSGRSLTASVSLFFENSKVIDAPLGNADEPVRRKGYVANIGYRLGPDATLSLAGSWLTTLATEQRPGTNLQTASVTLEKLMGRRTRASVGLRYSVFNAAVSPYKEAALTARLNHRF
jgi:uncharacterized protein (PEP-CTERM system associated)